MSDSYFDDEENGKSSGFLFKIPTVIWDRRWYVIVPTIAAGVAGIAAAILMPTTYESKATLLVESSELAKDNGANTSEAVDRRMAKIRQQLLSRPDLIELIQKYGLYKSSEKGELLSKLVERMRSDNTIEAIDAVIGGSKMPAWSKGQNGSIAFGLSFTYSRPDLTQIVAQNFVDKLLKLDSETLQGEAKLNLKLLTDQEAELQSQLSAVNSQINLIAGQGGSSLVASPILAMGGGAAGYQTQIAELRRQNIQLSSQLGSSGISRDPGVVAAEAQLSAARSIYADNHPDVKLAEARLAAARSAAANFETKSLSGSVAQQIAANNATIAQLSAALNAENAPPLAVVPIIKYAPTKGFLAKFLGKKSSKRPSAKEK